LTAYNTVYIIYLYILCYRKSGSNSFIYSIGTGIYKLESPEPSDNSNQSGELRKTENNQGCKSIIVC